MIFHHFGDELYLLPCTANFRPDHCLSLRKSCPQAAPSGGDLILALHGNRGVCREGGAFGSPWRYALKTLWWYSFNLSYVAYSARISAVVTGEQGLFTRAYKFFRDVNLEAAGGGGGGGTVAEFEASLTGSPGLEGDLCAGAVKAVIRAVKETGDQSR